MEVSPSKSIDSPPPSRLKRIARAKAILKATILQNKWIPLSYREKLTIKQAEFLCYEGRECLYGGAAGGGKSVALLMAALQFVDVPGYNALILRRTYAQLSKAESIMAQSKEWLTGKAHWRGSEHQWIFPSGATLAFGHMENDSSVWNYQGAAYSTVCYDELTQFKEPMYRYLFSRTRRRKEMAVKPRMRAASNPGGIGHEWVKTRFILPQEKPNPHRIFIAAKLGDNPNLDAEEYRKSLAELDPATRKQLEDGNWDAVGGGRFHKEWFKYFTRRGDYATLTDERGSYEFKPHECIRFITVDPAASAKTTADFTVISVWCISPRADLVWLDCIRVQKEIPDIVPVIQQACSQYRPAYVAIESIAANSAVFQFAQRAVNPAIICRPVSPLGQDKLVRASAAMNLMSTGRVWLPASNPMFPLDAVKSELILFTGDEKMDAHDDIVDTLSYAVECLTSSPTAESQRQAPRVIGGGG